MADYSLHSHITLSSESPSGETLSWIIQSLEETISDLREDVEELKDRLTSMQARKDEIPQPLIRYGVMWRGPQDPICVPMKDGLWTPWQEANDKLRATLEQNNTEKCNE